MRTKALNIIKSNCQICHSALHYNFDYESTSVDTHKRIHLINFFRKFTSNSIFFLIPLHFIRIGFPGWQIGFIMACYAAAPLIFSFPAGWVNDRFSIKRALQVAILLMGPSIFLISCTKIFILMAVIFLFLGIANNMLDVSINNYFYKDPREMDQNKKFGLLSFWLALGIAAGTLFGGTLTHLVNFKTLFYIYTFLLFSMLPLTFKIDREHTYLVSLREYKLSLINRKTILFAVIILILTLHWGAEGTVYSPFLKEYFGLNNLQLSLYISLPLFMMALSAFLFSSLKYDLRKNKRLFLIAMFASGLGLILMVNKNIYVSFLFRILHELGDGLIGAAVVLYMSRLFEKKNIGGSSGMLLMIMTCGHIIGSLAFSFLGFHVGLHLPFIVAGCLLILNTFYANYVFRVENY